MMILMIVWFSIPVFQSEIVYTKIPASIISIGPKRSETIDRYGKWF